MLNQNDKIERFSEIINKNALSQCKKIEKQTEKFRKEQLKDLESKAKAELGPHFDYICQGVTYGIARLNASQEIPVIYGLLTTNDLQQAKDRSGGKLGNKGDECAIDAIKMAKF